MDQSTDCGSLALLQDEHVLGEMSWTDSRCHRQQLFDRLPALLERTSLALSQVDCFAVGLGPGSYTGLRMAVATVMGLALPDRRSVYGVSSAEAMAAAFLAESVAVSAMVIGDARRHQLWARLFTRQEGGCAAASPWMLREPEALAELQASAWITPDWDRIGFLLKAQVPSACRLIEERRIPTAALVGLAACRRIRAAIPSEPLTPIYLHPAVAVPRPPASAPAAAG
ncbi:MAG: tRNA (adenosine(37)-N6)-threonylcarbamoyltransferase complex dimerization subunit type 1 TsaB [Verrucomicrobia bacterium]|nr:tRNA (adenosine(37)-N6)-threonylcarbamoyltransferase complex dimerization subunit type 1 TsaB [Verrucomicrobiota bacterium]MCG2681910.1 tRNA (adenosine(37)-N6)-threonylcarbamoyltransferase complex dimerization subunit type 1 TsaB [Kiritimatiellia bacterium]MBU4246750.1 tRNA (adenosine(37)-N6)-threonylcarbamoyltransferase complex dimerization subunit type 1 TsaB [Verrucomicrobiota bacterium]MBU4291171.1 tRNA (adenosine(37)-N6)-threonylcarbamoyltransferase complex dimerization subunit type 1 Ts